MPASRLMALVFVVSAMSIAPLWAEGPSHNKNWTEPKNAHMAERVRRDFLHAWKRLQAVRVGT